MNRWILVTSETIYFFAALFVITCHTHESVSVDSERKKGRNKKARGCLWQKQLQLFTMMLKFHCRNYARDIDFLLSQVRPWCCCHPASSSLGGFVVPAPWWCLRYFYSKLSGCYCCLYKANPLCIRWWPATGVKKQDSLYGSVKMVLCDLTWKNVIVQRTGLNNRKARHALNENSPCDTARKIIWKKYI